MTERLFSYGTLRQPDVQLALFGRAVPTTPDALPRFVRHEVVITDPNVIVTSGSDRHPILRRGRETDVVEGSCLELTEDELAAADDYEVDDYVRIPVTLASGLAAWVYVAGDEG